MIFWHIKEIISLIKCVIVAHDEIVKERMSECNFNFKFMLNDFDQPKVEDDGKLNLFGAVSIYLNNEVRISIGSRLAKIHANKNNEYVNVY